MVFRTFSNGNSGNGRSSAGIRSFHGRGSNGSVRSGSRSGGGLTGFESRGRGGSGRTSRDGIGLTNQVVNQQRGPLVRGPVPRVGN